MEAYEAALKEYQQCPFWRKIQFTTHTNTLLMMHSMVRFDGYVRKKADLAVTKDAGEHYVYLWKHMCGDVFYIGSGCGERWTDISGRNNDFYAHIDAGDGVVYKIIDGISEKEARLFERYVSLSFRVAGESIVNRDNQICRGAGAAEKEAVAIGKDLLNEQDVIAVEDTILNKILLDCDFDFADARARDCFLREYGNKYFAQKHGVKTDC